MKRSKTAKLAKSKIQTVKFAPKKEAFALDAILLIAEVMYNIRQEIERKALEGDDFKVTPKKKVEETIIKLGLKRFIS